MKSILLYFLFFILLSTAGCNTKKRIAAEGFVDVTGGKIWYHIYGSGDKSPLLVLHGGPGSSSYGLEPLSTLSNDRPVILFDQLGCGRSTRITDTSLMTVDHFADQVEQLRKALQLENFYLYGQSWGGTLAMEYFMKYPKEVKALVFSSPLLSTSLWIKDADTLIASLPDSVQAIIRENEKNKTYESKEYKEVVNLYYSKFLRRTERTKAEADSGKMFFGTNVYEYMWGPSEFTATGNLLNYDRVKDLPGINVPTLFLTGEYDEARPATIRYFHNLVPNSEFVLINNSGHATIHDNPGEALSAIKQFIERVEK